MRRRGFSLLELLIVLVIIGILATTVILNFVGQDRDVVLRAEAERLAIVIELARNEALTRNEAWGVFVDADGYSFAVYDEEGLAWQEVDERPFEPRPGTPGAAITIEAESVQREDEDDNELPDILIFASGEQTPFRIELAPEWESEPWFVHSDGLQRTRAQRESDMLEDDEGA